VTSAAIVGLAALAVLALVVGFCWWMAAWARGLSKEVRGLDKAVLEHQQGIEERDGTIDALASECDRERAARTKAEEILRDAQKRLVEAGSPADIVAGVNASLLALGKLSEVSRTAPPAAGEDRGEAGPVHGRAEPPPLPDVPEPE